MIRVCGYAIDTDSGLSFVVGKPRKHDVTHEDGSVVKDEVYLSNKTYHRTLSSALQNICERMRIDAVSRIDDGDVKSLVQTISNGDNKMMKAVNNVCWGSNVH